MALLESIRGPEDIRRLGRDQLQPLADEVRRRLIDVVSQTGGHIGAGLGVVELTVALCYSFESPRDRIVWDVGHQAYPWKILTGRNDRLPTLRQPGGRMRHRRSPGPEARARQGRGRGRRRRAHLRPTLRGDEQPGPLGPRRHYGLERQRD